MDPGIRDTHEGLENTVARITVVVFVVKSGATMIGYYCFCFSESWKLIIILAIRVRIEFHRFHSSVDAGLLTVILHLQIKIAPYVRNFRLLGGRIVVSSVQKGASTNAIFFRLDWRLLRLVISKLKFFLTLSNVTLCILGNLIYWQLHPRSGSTTKVFLHPSSRDRSFTDIALIIRYWR